MSTDANRLAWQNGQELPLYCVEICYELVRKLKEKNVLTMEELGTSQETSDIETIRQIALYNKMAGFDIHHIGDAGDGGVAIL